MGLTTDLKRIKEHVGGLVPLHMAGSPRNSLGEISHCPVAVYFRQKSGNVALLSMSMLASKIYLLPGCQFLRSPAIVLRSGARHRS